MPNNGEIFYATFPIPLNANQTDSTFNDPGLDDVFPPLNFEIIGTHIINPTGGGTGNLKGVMLVLARVILTF